VVGWWRILHSEELHGVSFVPDNSRVMKASIKMEIYKFNTSYIT
jgi:hypothetical protein